MTTGYGINGISYSPLGNVGLGSTGTYASYDYCMPSSMGMMGGMPGMYTMPGMMGMYNYMNPETMTQMSQRIETSHLNHASNMHGNVKAMEVNNGLQSSDALAAQILNEGDIQERLSHLKSKIDSGDLQGAVQLHKELKGLVYNRYKDQIAARGEETNVQKGVLALIDNSYYSLHGTQIKADLAKCGETPMMNGFMQLWKKGHSNMTIQEAESAMYGTRIDAAASEQADKLVGKVGGGIASIGQGMAYGGGLAAAAVSIWSLGSALLGAKWAIPSLNTAFKFIKGFAVAGGLGNLVWKLS